MRIRRIALITVGVVLILAAAVKVTTWVRESRPSYVALGDSLAVGLGSFITDGYVYRYHRWLGDEKFPTGITLHNLGQNGWTCAELLDHLQSSPIFIQAVSAAHFITLDIGGNDMLGCGEDEIMLAVALQDYRHLFPQTLSRIRELNPEAVLLLIDLYNPFPAADPRHERAAKWLTEGHDGAGGFNSVMRDAAQDPRFRVAGITDLRAAFSGREEELVWIEEIGDIHPNARGQEVIFRELVSITP